MKLYLVDFYGNYMYANIPYMDRMGHNYIDCLGLGGSMLRTTFIPEPETSIDFSYGEMSYLSKFL